MRGYEHNGKYSADPVGSDKPRGKSSFRRKHRNDGATLTPSEQYKKQGLMRQFMRTGEGPGGNTPAYVAGSCWCEACGRHFKVEGRTLCGSCLSTAAELSDD